MSLCCAVSLNVIFRFIRNLLCAVVVKWTILDMNDSFLQKSDGSEHAEVVTMCCAIKPLASWLLEEISTTTRERCGGQGYLSCNRFGTFLGNAHAAMTAEGDNSVLMQKASCRTLPINS